MMSVQIESAGQIDFSEKKFFEHQDADLEVFNENPDADAVDRITPEICEKFDQLKVNQDDEGEMSFTEFCDEFCTEGEIESEPFTVLSAEDVVDLMKNETEKVCEIVNLPPAQLRMLLTKYKWDTEKFLEKFFDGSVELPEKILNSLTDQVNQNPNAEMECDICALDCEVEIIRKLNCGHFFCSDCLKTYIESSVTQGALFDCIKCPGFACDMPIDDDFVADLLPEKLESKYQQLVTSGFVNSNRRLRWCPSPDCSNAVKVDVIAPDQPAVICHCSSRFCFACYTENHDLIPCKLVQDFQEVKKATLSTSLWVVRFTKPCPQCKTDIEKNAGCNHMTCRQCKYEFCWICSLDWKHYAYHNCVPPESNAYQCTDMRRLANYDTKLQVMRQSIKLDQDQYKSKFDQQIENVKNQWFKIDFMVDAVELLLSCRRTLADSYIFFYFHELFDEHEDDLVKMQWLLLKKNHSNLTAATENLSRKLETIVDGDNFHDLKREVKDLVAISRGLQRAVKIQVREGFENNTWVKRYDSV